MKAMIAGFDELILQCQNEQARTHIREAVTCYQASAYRAAIVAAYISVSFDLIEKLRTLAAGGDGEAQLAEAELNNLQEQQNSGNLQAVTGLLKFERNLLELFRDKFEFFGVHEFEDLDRLRADRNRCAHPTFSLSTTPYAPSAELARLHIRSALTLVLTQPARQGKAALEGLRNVVLAPYFPSDVAEARQRLANTELASARAALLTAFIDDLSFGWSTKDHPYYQKGIAAVAIEAAVELNRAGTLERVTRNATKLVLSAEKDSIRFGIAMALRVPDAGEAISEPARVVARAWLKDEGTPFRGNAICRAVRLTWLDGAAREAAGTLSVDELAAITFADKPPEVIQRAVDLYSAASSWNEANRIADKAAIPFADKFEASQVEQVIESASSRASDLQGSGGFKRFLAAVAHENPLGVDGVNDLLAKHDLVSYTVATVEVPSPEG